MTEPYYQDDRVTLYHGDCLEIDAWLDADVLVTDPPYGIGHRKQKGRWDRKTYSLDTTATLAGDKCLETRDAAIRAWGEGRPRIVFGSWRAPRPEPVQHRLIWHKAGQTTVGAFSSAFALNDEEIYVTGTGFRRSSKPLLSVIPTYENRAATSHRIGHSTSKPIPLMELLIDRCPPGIIADPFAGSGSTLVAARNLGRKSVGVELDERYCEITADRLDQQCLDLGS